MDYVYAIGAIILGLLALSALATEPDNHSGDESYNAATDITNEENVIEKDQ